MDADTKLTVLIVGWILDKVIMWGLFHWELRRKKRRKIIITKDFCGRINIDTNGEVDGE